MDVAHRALNRIVPRHVLQCEGVGGVGVLPGLGQKADRVERVGRRLFLSFAFLASNDSIDSMATLTIRQLDERTKTRLRVRAAHHGRSMERRGQGDLAPGSHRALPSQGEFGGEHPSTISGVGRGRTASAATRRHARAPEIWRMIILDTMSSQNS